MIEEGRITEVDVTLRLVEAARRLAERNAVTDPVYLTFVEEILETIQKKFLTDRRARRYSNQNEILERTGSINLGCFKMLNIVALI